VSPSRLDLFNCDSGPWRSGRGSTGPRRRRGKRSRPCAAAVVRPAYSAAVDGSPPSTPMVGRRFSTGKRRDLRPPRFSLATTQKQPLQTRKVPAELCGRCFKCLSYSHQGATCWLSPHCLCCHGFHHLAKDCKRPRHVAASAMKGDDRPRHLARDGNLPASQHVVRSGPLSSDGALHGGTGGASGSQW
jgi:hypothetical protein